MKRTFKILSFLLALVFVMSVFTACMVEQPPEVIEKVTVQWVQGQKLLKEETVEKGTKLTPWTPEIEGKEFQGWYERPYIKKFDFDKPITKSIRIYASFKSATGGEGGEDSGEFVVPDWYLIGAGKGDLSKANNWDHEAAAKNLGLFAGEDGIYRITLNLYAGDQFKMTKDFGWDAEVAIGGMAGHDNGVVKDSNGTVVFTAGENNNFVVAPGQDGKYEITYDPTSMLMGFKLIEKLEGMPDDIRLIGDINGWSTVYGEEDWKFTSDDNVNWTLVWEVTSPSTFKVYNNLSGVYFPGGVGNDLTINPGTYTVKFNSETREIVVLDENGNSVDVGFTNNGDNGGGESGGSTVTPNANPVDKVYLVVNSAWNDGSMMGAWTWGSGSDIWADVVATADPNVFEVTIPTGQNMIIFVDFSAGTTDKSWDAKREQTADLAIPDKSDDKIYYHVANGTWSNSSEATTPGGGSGNGEATTEAITVFFQNNWLWTNVSCHYWGDGIETPWPGAPMTKVGGADGYDVYSIEIPAGVTGFLFTGIKNNGSGETDKSPDLSPEGLASGAGFKMVWNGANAVEGFTYDPSACVHTYVGGVCNQCGARIAYTVAGTDNLCGTAWDTNNTANDMVYDEATGKYVKEYAGLSAGTYEFKVVQDHSWGVNWGDGGPNAGDFKVELSEGATLVIIFDGSTVTYEVK